MAGDEPRRSIRSNRGQHSKLAQEHVVLTPQAKGQRRGKKATASEKSQNDPDPDDDEEDGPMRCICGATTEDPKDDQPWIACDECKVWQHNVCMGISEWDEDQPDNYFCEQCRPDNHKDLLAGVERGEQPWKLRHDEYLERKREAADRKKRGVSEKKKRGGKRSKRLSDPAARRSKGADGSPATTPVPSGKDSFHNSNNADTPEAVKDSQSQDQIGGQDQTTDQDEAILKSPILTTPKAERTTPKVIIASQKRRDPFKGDSETPVAKLRKGSDGQAVPLSPSVELSSKEIQQLPDTRRGPTFAINKALSYGAGVTLQSTEKIAISIEDAVFTTHPNHNSYAQQCRTLAYNLKSNRELAQQALNGKISSLELASMSSQDMQTKEQQRQEAEIIARATKQATLNDDDNTGPRIRRTHKGEEFVEMDENVGVNVSAETASKTALSQHATEEDDDRHEDHHASKAAAAIPSPNTFDVGKALDKMPPPVNKYSNPPQQVQQTEDAEVDRLIGESPQYSPAADPAPLEEWRGILEMPGAFNYPVIGRYAAGFNPPQDDVLSWDVLLPTKLIADGRVNTQQANQYLCGLRYVEREVSVLYLTPADPKDKQEHEEFIQYMLEANRTLCLKNVTEPAREHPLYDVTDLYLFTLPAGADSPHQIINHLWDKTVPENRLEPMVFCAAVVRPSEEIFSRREQRGVIPPSNPSKEPNQSCATLTGIEATATPANQHGGAKAKVSLSSREMASGGGSTQNGAARQQQTPASTSGIAKQYTLSQRKMREVFGPFADVPSAKFLLPLADRMAESELLLVRSLFEDEPETRSDLSKLDTAIAARAPPEAALESATEVLVSQPGGNPPQVTQPETGQHG